MTHTLPPPHPNDAPATALLAAFARNHGMPVPANRATRAWIALRRVWVDYDFEGLAGPERPVIALSCNTTNTTP